MSLEKQLRSIYQFDKIRVLSDYFELPSATLYKELHYTRQDVFPDNYRFIFSCLDNPPIEQVENFLIKLQKSLSFVDIGNYFALVVTNDNRIPALLEKICQQYSRESDPISCNIVDLRESTYSQGYSAILNTPASICAQPWISLEISSIGDFKPCCFYTEPLTDSTGRELSVATDSLEDVYNSASMTKLRQEFLSGKRPNGCERCWKEENDNTKSKRQLLAQRFPPYSFDTNWEQNSVDNLKFVSISFGNLCNLKCRICNPSSSSKIATEEAMYASHKDKNLFPIKEITNRTKWVKDKDLLLWDSLVDPALDLLFFDFAGGEPMLIPAHFDVLQKLVSQGKSKNVTLHYNTNGTTFPEEFVNVWQNFKTVDIAISIDNIKKRFDYERSGGNWDKLVTHLNQYFSIQSDVIKISMHLAVNIQNVFYLPEITKWVNQQPFSSVHYSTVYDPEYMSISAVTKSARKIILAKLESANSSNEHINNIINILRNAKCSNGKLFVGYMKELDKRRNENFVDLYPEVAKAMGY